MVVVVVVAAITGAIRLAGRQYRSVQEGSIKKMLASSQSHEAAGRLDLALVDLDAAIDLIRRSGASNRFPLNEQQEHRGDLARREAEAVLGLLVQDRRNPYPLGDWLTLIARTKKDSDLSSLGPRIVEEFRRSARQRTTIELDAARRDFGTGRVVASLQACDRIAKLLPHLTKDAEVQVRRDTLGLVERLVETHGVALETPKGDFVFGSEESYRARLLPILLSALEAKSFLPYRDTSPWKSAWQKALYHLHLVISERRAGNYLSSENRVTWIEVHLILTSTERKVWETKPAALTKVPLPGLPAYLSSRVAASGHRSDEIERLLYENARGQIVEKFSQGLTNMPGCCP
jgi:hypothetical protein